MNLNRRQALKGAAAISAFQIVPRRLLGGQGYIPPSEELTRGIIGCGGISRAHIGYKGAKIIGLCDVDEGRLKEKHKKSKGEIKGREGGKCPRFNIKILCILTGNIITMQSYDILLFIHNICILFYFLE